MHRFTQRVRAERRSAFAPAAGLGLTAVGLTFLAGCGGGSGSAILPNPSPTVTASPSPSLAYSGTLERSDAQMRAVIQKFLSFNAPPVYTVTPQQARTLPTIADAVRGVLQDQGRSTAPEPVASVQDRTVPGPAGAIPVRVYTPSGTGPFPVTVYYHGGGWVIATIDTYDSSCRAIANAAQTVVVSVEYRKGPENRFPAAHEDAYVAFQYVANNTAEFGGDPSRVATAGESAGGNLAVAVGLMSRDRGGKLPVYQLSVYPIADNDTTRPSYNENAEAVPLNRPSMQYFFNNYLNTPAEGDNPLISLVQANLAGLPPTTVITAEIDPLRSEGQDLATRLTAAGVSTRYRNYTGVTHEFFGTGAVVDKGKEAVAFAAEGLRSAFTQPAD
ncbi:MAG: alpha/beta hydrolase [Armatimonadota bacterium]